MKLTQINQDTSSDTGFLDFDVINAGTIRRVTVSPTIATGDMFNIYYGDGVYTPYRKQGCRFLSKSKPDEQLIKTIERSIRKSEVFVGEHTSSAAFVARASAKWSSCCYSSDCRHMTLGQSARKHIVAVDLDYPDYGRESPRQMAVKFLCPQCKQDAIVGVPFAPPALNGLDLLTQAANECAIKLGLPAVDWSVAVVKGDSIIENDVVLQS